MSAALFAQAPQKFTYQAVVRDGNNKLLANAPVGVSVSILQGRETGTAVYEETHSASANANGLLTLQIGVGEAVTGSFADIDWANGSYYVKIETAPCWRKQLSVEQRAAAAERAICPIRQPSRQCLQWQI